MKKIDSIKWRLWHGDKEVALERLTSLKQELLDKTAKAKVSIVIDYLKSNFEFLVNYSERKEKGLVYTSQPAESMIGTLINERFKKKQKMHWSREGAHHVLQIRSSIVSNEWAQTWDGIGVEILKRAA